MNNLTRRNFIKSHLSLLVIYSLLGCKEKMDKLIYTSDTHVSLPEGRYAFMTKRYTDFLNKFSRDNNLFFINGDFIDNAYSHNGKIVGGDIHYQEKETRFFLELTKQIYKNNGNQLLLNFGSGHDFGSLALSEKLTNQPRLGKYKWKNIDLIWFTIQRGSFSNKNGPEPDLLNHREYVELEKMLAVSNNAIIFSHIPLRTAESFELGKWSKETNLTIPLSDKIYEIIHRHSSRIVAIFTGHIHKSYKSYYGDIPIFSFPFMENDCHCEIVQKRDRLELFPRNSTVENEIIHF